MTAKLSTVNILRNQIKIEKENVAEYREMLEWVMLAVEQEVISRDEIVEKVETVLSGKR